MKRKIILGLAPVLSGVLFGCSTPAPPVAATAPPSQIQEQVERLPEGHFESFRVFPIGKPIYDESWLGFAPAATAVVRRYVFVPTGKGRAFYVTFVFADSARQAQWVWDRYCYMTVQVAGRKSRNYGADEIESWDAHLIGRWRQTVVTVSTDRNASTDEWPSVMKIIESVNRLSS
jgi:hypothetical protein